MNGIVKLGCLALAVWPLIGAAPAGSHDEPASYAVRVPIIVAAGSTVHRLAIPAEVFAASQTPDLSDSRLFDARGRAMPMARVGSEDGPPRRDVLPALPILGAADALTVTGVSLRLDGRGRARVAQVEGTIPGGLATAVELGVLFDARAVEGKARSLTLDADVPVTQPVTFTVEASADLKDWRSIAEEVFYHAAMPDGSGASVALPLGDAVFNDDYLRVTWRAVSRLLSPVTVRRAALVARPNAIAADAFIDAISPPLTDAHTIEFTLPFATAIGMIRVVPTGTDVIVPIRILGRDDREQPWPVLGKGIAARAGSGTGGNDGIVLGGGSHRTLRIEADQRSTGFTSVPALSFGFASRSIVFLAAGRPPFDPAAGWAKATDMYLPFDSLMTQAAGRPISTAATKAADALLRLEAVNDTSALRRQALLWAVLLGATAILATMAWRLWRRGMGARRAPDEQQV